MQCESVGGAGARAIDIAPTGTATSQLCRIAWFA